MTDIQSRSVVAHGNKRSALHRNKNLELVEWESVTVGPADGVTARLMDDTGSQ